MYIYTYLHLILKHRKPQNLISFKDSLKAYGNLKNVECFEESSRYIRWDASMLDCLRLIFLHNSVFEKKNSFKISCNPTKAGKISTSGVLRWLGGLRQIPQQYAQIETRLADAKVQHKAAIKGHGSFTEQTGQHDRMATTALLCTITSKRFPLAAISVSCH